MQTDVRAWTRDLWSGIRDRDISSVIGSLRGAFNGPYFTLTTRYPIGTNIYERDWDLLIVLDACRADALRTVAPEYDFIEAVDSIWSVGSSSHEWISKTFTNEYRSEIEKTVLVTTNPFVPQVFDQRLFPPKTYSIPLMWANWDVVEKSAFDRIVHVHHHDLEEYFSHAPPQVVTDNAVKAHREVDPDRMVVHYLQPHTPYIANSYRERRPLTEVEENPWKAMNEGIATREEVRKLYLNDLRFVLDDIEERLLRNIDAPNVVITADHGDLFGKFMYGHPEGFVHPNLKRVPWATATGTDHHECTPDVDLHRPAIDEGEAEEQLEQLGYL